MREVRHAVRSLLRTPAFTTATVLTLAIAIGAATAIYSVVDTILLRPLPFPGGDRIVRLVEYAPHFQAGRPPVRRGLTYPEFVDWRDRVRTLTDVMAAVNMAQRMVPTPDGAAGLWGAGVSGNTFQALGAQALLGRTLLPSDDAAPDVVVLSYDTWRRHWHGDRSVVGKTIELRTGALMAPIPWRVLTVVGVMPASFELPIGTLDYFTPIVVTNPPQRFQVTTFARLAQGATIADATAEVDRMGASLRAVWPADKMPPAGPRFEMKSVKEGTVGPLRPALGVMLAAVVLVLLVACANVSNLMLARGMARQREIAVRLAVGASRGNIARQVLVESLVLAIAGGAIGAVLGAAGVTLVKQLASVDAPGVFRLMFGTAILPRAHEIAVNWRLPGIAFSIAAATAMAFGLLPALHLAGSSQLHAMGSRGSGSTRSAARLRAVLVVGQLVMATMLLVGAGLLINSFRGLASFNKGYDPSRVLAFNLLFPDQYSTARKGETIDALLARFRAKPGVTAAGFARHGILIGEELYIGRFVVPGGNVEEAKGVRTRSVSDGFLTAMNVPLLNGRDFLPTDTASTVPVIVINRSAAMQYFGRTDAVGQRIDWHIGNDVTPMTVAGVVEDVRQEAATDTLVPEVFVNFRQYMALEAGRDTNESAIGFLSFAVRTRTTPASLVPAIREALNAVDPNIGIDAIAPMADLEASSTARERFYAVMLGTFSSIAAILAAIGIYGVLAYAVAQRTQEIGVRMALGARRSQVMSLILRRGLQLTAVGVIAGLIGAAASARYLQSMLFGIEPLDPWTFAQVASAFSMVAALASYVPARRATAVDPVVALRHE